MVACVHSIVATPHAVAELLGRLLLHLHRSSSPELFRMLGELGLAGREALEVIERSRVSLIEEFTATLSDAERDELHATLLPIVERIPSP